MSSRDRLAASRAQRGQAIELSNVTQPPVTQTSTSTGGGLTDLSSFLAEDKSIQEGIQQLRENVTQISALRLQSLNMIDDLNHAESGRIEALTTETRSLMQSLKERIRRMSAPSRQDIQLRNNRITVLRSKFLEAIQEYQREELESRAKSKQRVERQLMIVKPDATSQEVAAAVDGGGQQVFAQALTTSTRYGESRDAYKEVQERQEDLKRVERTLAELAQLFSDMGTLVEEQDELVTDIERTAQGVTQDTGNALGNVGTAVKHARSYRKARWVCFFICVVILIAIAAVLGVVFGRKK